MATYEQGLYVTGQSATDWHYQDLGDKTSGTLIERKLCLEGSPFRSRRKLMTSWAVVNLALSQLAQWRRLHVRLSFQIQAQQEAIESWKELKNKKKGKKEDGKRKERITERKGRGERDPILPGRGRVVVPRQFWLGMVSWVQRNPHMLGVNNG